jgi:hypothetical protein
MARFAEKRMLQLMINRSLLENLGRFFFTDMSGRLLHNGFLIKFSSSLSVRDSCILEFYSCFLRFYQFLLLLNGSGFFFRWSCAN